MDTIFSRSLESKFKLKVDKVAGIEARGFILGGAVAHQVSAGFVPIRKKGKLPHTTVRIAYSLEYGLDEMEIHEDAIKPGQKVLMVDDLLATGGTMAACCRLVEALGGSIVGVAILIELEFLGCRKQLAQYRLHSILKVAGE